MFPFPYYYHNKFDYVIVGIFAPTILQRKYILKFRCLNLEVAVVGLREYNA